MKILHIIDSGGLYGAEVMLLNLMEEQRHMGLVPILASIGEPGCEDKPLETEARRRGLRVETFRMRPGPNIAGILRVLRFARNEGVDIIHSHGYKGNILFGLMPKLLRRIPMVTTLHGWTWSGGLDRMCLYEWLDRLSLRFIDRVVVVSGSMLGKVRLNGVCVVNNGIPTNPTNPTDPTDPTGPIAEFCAQGYSIGAIGRLSPEKGFDKLLEAVGEVAARHPEVRLAILGEGSERGVLEARVKNLGLEKRVLMPGYVENAGRCLPFFRIFALSSFTEGLPMVILEAMQAGVPIVSTGVGAIAEVLENGKAGILVEPGRSGALAAGFEEVIINPAAAEQRSEAAGARLTEHYSSKAMAEKYREIYRTLVDCPSRSYRAQPTQ